jgi:hypothetical protein
MGSCEVLLRRQEATACLASGIPAPCFNRSAKYRCTWEKGWQKKAGTRIQQSLEIPDARAFERHRAHKELKERLYSLATKALSHPDQVSILKSVRGQYPVEHIEILEKALGPPPRIEKELRSVAERTGVSYETARKSYYDVILPQARDDLAMDKKLRREAMEGEATENAGFPLSQQ